MDAKPARLVPDQHPSHAAQDDIVLTGDVETVGRSDQNSVALRSDMVSRFHARLRRRPEGWVLEDRQSSSGTYVNGQLNKSRLLSPGDRVQIGGFVYVFKPGS